MAITHTINLSLTGAAASLSGSLSATCDNEQHTEVALDASAADVQTLVAFTMAALKSFYYICDQNSVIKTNSSSAADNTFTIPANKPFVWNNAMLLDNPFTADVTKFYITNSAATAGTARIIIGSDGTP